MNLKRNTIINLLGTLVPMGVSLVTVPLFLEQIGEARYGVLAIVWLLLGYFGMFDMGISRATTNHIARLRAAPEGEREQVFWTAAGLNTLFGLVGGVLLYAIATPLVTYTFKMPGPMRIEVLSCLPWLALSIPLATVSGVFSGTLEGYEQFGTLNIIEATGEVLFRVIPLAVAYIHGPGLRWLIISALLVRAAFLIPLFVKSARAVPLRWKIRPAKVWIRPLFEYGGWVTVNSVLKPLFGSLDRFLVGAGVGAVAVTVYTVPGNLIRRVQILPAALSRTLFPRFSGLSGPEARDLGTRSVKALAVITLPAMMAAIVLIHPFLSLWISPQFAGRASGVGEVIALGVWMSSLAFIPYGLLQGQGQPRTVALVHTAEAPVFVLAMWLGVRAGGVIGAAWVASCRDAADAVLFLALGDILPGVASRLSAAGAWLIATLLLVRFSENVPYISLAGGAILILLASLWAVRTEPLLHDLISRLRIKVTRFSFDW